MGGEDVPRVVDPRRRAAIVESDEADAALTTLQPWYAEVEPTDNAALYLDEARKADDQLFSTVEAHVGIVTNIDEKSRSCFVTFRLDGSSRYRYHRTPWEKALPEPGAFVTVKFPVA